MNKPENIEITQIKGKKTLFALLKQYGINECELEVGESEEFEDIIVERISLVTYNVTRKNSFQLKTDEQLQRELDEKKYFASEKAKKDMSGAMDFCYKCQFRNTPYNECKLNHETRVENSVCAKSFRKNK